MQNTTDNQTLTQVFNLLKYTFGIVPIVAGIDKFLNLLTDWSHYIDPSMADLLPFSATTFMMIVGVIEIVAGIIVLRKAEIGGYVVTSNFNIIDKEITLNDILLLKEKIKDNETVYGNIGQDLIQQFHKMTINFEQMFIKFE